eukprot:scaffold742_cov263-Pinguiococcus_pyrenoidosus.AAC.6
MKTSRALRPRGSPSTRPEIRRPRIRSGDESENLLHWYLVVRAMSTYAEDRQPRLARNLHLLVSRRISILIQTEGKDHQPPRGNEPPTGACFAWASMRHSQLRRGSPAASTAIGAVRKPGL